MHAAQPKDVKKRELVRDAERLLGSAPLAKYLKVQEPVLESWVRGDSSMPDGKLLDLAAALADLAQSPRP